MEAGAASWVEASDSHSSISWMSGKVAAQEIGCRERMGNIVCVGGGGGRGEAGCRVIPRAKGFTPACLEVSLGARKKSGIPEKILIPSLRGIHDISSSLGCLMEQAQSWKLGSLSSGLTFLTL